MDPSQKYIELEAKLAQLRLELEEANDVIEAIRSGEVDALVVKGKDGHQLFTLKSADQTYRIFIEQMTESAVTLDRMHRVLYCNSQFAKLLGIPLEKVIGLDFAQFVVAEDQLLVIKIMESSWLEDAKMELRLLNRSGKTIPVQLSLKALELDEGTSLSIVLTDLTTLKNTQFQLQIRNEELQQAQKIAAELNNNLEQTVKTRTAELHLNEQRLTSILQTMGEGLCLLDQDGKVRFANQEALKIFALDATEILRRDVYSLQKEYASIDGTTLEEQEHPISIMRRKMVAIYDQEIRICNAANDLLFISINASPLFEEGNFSGIVMTFSDVSNRRKIALQKDEFISIASHEIKTPLTSLKASMQLLTKVMESKPDSDRVPILIQKANSNLAKVVHLAEDLMNVSKIQLGPLPLNKQLFQIKDLILDCVEQVFYEGSIKLVLEGETTLSIFADQQRIGQVLINLFNNVLKYAANSNEVKVSIASTKGFLRVSVQDFGSGIAEEKLSHLFDRYYQVDPEGKQVSGMGLGLYISHEIIARHGGQLTVSSMPGAGSTFTFTLPL